MIRYIILLLLFSCGLSAQTKLRQIERSATKWYVPAAWDSIPGVTGHAMKYIDLETLMDTVGIQQFGIDSIIYRNDSLLIYNGPGYYFAIIPQGLSGAGDDGSVAYWHQDTIAGDTVHFWDRTNKRLGLNTKSPTSLLHVKKNEFSLPVAEFDNPGTNGQTVLIKHGASTDARYPLKIQTPASTTYFDARGYLGLGTSPGYPLHVYGSNGISRFENSGANGDAGFDLRNGNKWWRIALNAEGGTTNNVHFRDVTGGRYPITLQSSNGYVGILNLTPARELHVTGRVRVSALDSDLTPPTTAGPTKMVITDESGDLSFANIPSGGGGPDSTNIIGGWGIESTESPANTFNLIADSTQVASQYDLTLKQDKLTLTTTGTSGAATLTGATLNIPQYGNGDITGITTTAPITGGTTSGNATLGLSYDPTYMGLNGSNELYPLYNVATWNANALRGRSISITAPTNGQVYAYNSAGNNWVPTTTGAGTVTSVQLAAGTGISLAGTNPITTSGTITVTNSAPNVTTNLSYTNTTSPVTLNSSDGTDVTFTAGNNISLATNGNNMTITGTGATGSGTNTHVAFWTGSPAASLTSSAGLIWDNSNTRLIIGAPQTPTRSLDVNGSVRLRQQIADINNFAGNPGDCVTSNGASSWYWQHDGNYTYGQMSVDGNNSATVTTTFSKLNFSASVSSNTTVDVTTNETITVPTAGTYEVSYSLSYKASIGQPYEFRVHIGGTSSARSQMLVDPTDINDFYPISKTFIVALSANDALDLRVRASAGGSSATGTFEAPVLFVKRLK